MAVDFNRCHRLDKIPQALKKLKNGIKSGVVSIVTNGHNATNLYDQKNQLSYQAKNQQAIVATLDSDWEAADEVLSRGNIEREYQTKAIEAKSQPWELMTKSPVDICHLCGKDLYAGTDYETVWISDRESSDSHCLYPNGISSYSVEINILSNNLLILDHPFKHFPKLGIFDPQLVSEQIACAQAYAEQNIFFGYIGNITPNIYKSTEPNQFLVGNLKNQTKKLSRKNQFFLSYTEKLGSILTDREWIAACDLEYYLHLANLEINQLHESLNGNFTILAVQPGQWEITCFSHLHSRNENYKHYPLMIFKHCGEIKEKCASLSTFAVDSKYRSPEGQQTRP